MKLKLTYSGFMFLYELLRDETFKPEPKETIAKIVRLILVGLYKKFYSKAHTKESKYNIKLNPVEALAFKLYFRAHSFPNASFEGNLINQIITSIHQKYQL